MTYREAIQFLYDLQLFGTKLGLENTFELAALAGNPHQQLRFIHVAGTNGKGSTCAMLESVYRAAGLRVGLFTSPHLVSFRERIQVNRELISESDVVRLVEQMQCALRHAPSAPQVTFFELVTVMALSYFVEEECELVIWETGLGGQTRCNQYRNASASVITNIQLDHQKWLGSTLAQIAAEKGGIIKPGIPVVTAIDPAEPMAIIRDIALRRHAPLTHVTPSDTRQPPLGSVQLPLRGDHQRLNAAVALATVRVLAPYFPLNDQILVAGLSAVHWPGRLQRHVTTDGRTILLDGAHNPAGAESLRDALQVHFPGRMPTLILGILRDKDWPRMCEILALGARRILVAPVHSERTALPSDLQDVCLRSAPGLQVLPCASLAEALKRADTDPFVLIAGSLHFVGEAMELLELLPTSTGERGLNEWDAAASGLKTPTSAVR